MTDRTPYFPPPQVQKAMQDLAVEMEANKTRGWIWGAYGEALALVKMMEDRLAKGRFRRARILYDPLILSVRGLEQMVISYGHVYIGAAALGLLGLWFSSSVPIGFQQFAQFATLCLNAYLTLTVVFAAPSTYCAAGTNEKHVSDIKNKLAEWKIDSAKRVELLVKNVKIFEERTRRRLTIFRWLLGSGWALYVSPLISEAIKKWGATSFSLQELVALFPPIGFLLLAFVAIEAYSRGVDVVFRGIELGANERLADLDRKPGS
jgi:hypothetical protein